MQWMHWINFASVAGSHPLSSWVSLAVWSQCYGEMCDCKASTEDRQTQSNWLPRKTGTFLRHTSESGHLRQLSFSTLLLAWSQIVRRYHEIDYMSSKSPASRCASAALFRRQRTQPHRPRSLQRFQQLLSRFCSVGFFDLGLVGMLWCEGHTKDTRPRPLQSKKSNPTEYTICFRLSLKLPLIKRKLVMISYHSTGYQADAWRNCTEHAMSKPLLQLWLWQQLLLAFAPRQLQRFACRTENSSHPQVEMLKPSSCSFNNCYPKQSQIIEPYGVK